MYPESSNNDSMEETMLSSGTVESSGSQVNDHAFIAGPYDLVQDPSGLYSLVDTRLGNVEPVSAGDNEPEVSSSPNSGNTQNNIHQPTYIN